MGAGPGGGSNGGRVSIREKKLLDKKKEKIEKKCTGKSIKKIQNRFNRSSNVDALNLKGKRRVKC